MNYTYTHILHAVQTVQYTETFWELHQWYFLREKAVTPKYLFEIFWIQNFFISQRQIIHGIRHSWRAKHLDMWAIRRSSGMFSRKKFKKTKQKKQHDVQTYFLSLTCLIWWKQLITSLIRLGCSSILAARNIAAIAWCWK